jgi:hypothetical protein
MVFPVLSDLSGIASYFDNMGKEKPTITCGILVLWRKILTSCQRGRMDPVNNV